MQVATPSSASFPGRNFWKGGAQALGAGIAILRLRALGEAAAVVEPSELARGVHLLVPRFESDFMAARDTSDA